MADKVEIYDTTLRDGMQGEGMSLSVDEKLSVAHALDRLGVDLIEAGFLGSNPKDAAFFERLAEEHFDHAEIVAFGMTRRRDTTAADDAGLRQMAASWVPVCTLVGKTWALHLEKVTKVTREENLAMIGDSIAYLREAGKRVVYDAEHFFDAYREDAAYALDCLQAAAGAGAETVVLCDTNGSSLPGDITLATLAVVERLGGGVGGGLPPHDDAGCGVANALLAVQHGARHVQGTMNGYGERCGNANLVSIIPGLQLKLGFDCVTPEQLATLTETAHLVDEISNFTPNPDQPYVGRNAFAHKGGMHVAGVQADARTFEHMDPSLVGNSRDMLISELSGKGSVLERAETAGLDLDADAAKRALERIKEREHRGYHYEAADASFDRLLRREAGEYQPLFRL